LTDEIIIVGGGFGGLLSGAILSAHGYKVKIYEKKPILGGRANSIEYKPGYIVDYGIHAIRFSKKGVIPTIFKKHLKRKLKLVDYGEGKLFMNNEWHDLPLSISAIQNTNLLDDDEKNALTQVLAGALSIKINDEILDLSIKDWLKDKNLTDNTLKLITVITNLLCVSHNEIEKLSAGEFLDGVKKAISAGKGSSYPIGGWKFIIEELSNFIKENGGAINLKTPVDKVVVANNKIEGIYIKGEKIDCKTLILAIPIRDVFNLIDKTLFPKEFIEKAENTTPTCGISIDFGLKGTVSDIDGLITTYKPFTMSCFTSNLDPSTAPEGEQLYTLLQPLPQSIINNKSETEKIIKNIYEMLNSMFPGFNDKVLWKRPIVMPIVDGSTVYVTTHRNKRISVKSPIDGLYFSGDSYNGPGIGGDIAHASALLCAETIMSDLQEQ